MNCLTVMCIKIMTQADRGCCGRCWSAKRIQNGRLSCEGPMESLDGGLQQGIEKTYRRTDQGAATAFWIWWKVSEIQSFFIEEMKERISPGWLKDGVQGYI